MGAYYNLTLSIFASYIFIKKIIKKRLCMHVIIVKALGTVKSHIKTIFLNIKNGNVHVCKGKKKK